MPLLEPVVEVHLMMLTIDILKNVMSKPSQQHGQTKIVVQNRHASLHCCRSLFVLITAVADICTEMLQ